MPVTPEDAMDTRGCKGPLGFQRPQRMPRTPEDPRGCQGPQRTPEGAKDPRVCQRPMYVPRIPEGGKDPRDSEANISIFEPRDVV